MVYVLIPVFNRIAHTREIIACLRRQTGVQLRIVIVNDGSTDGTAEFLATQPDVITLNGNGQLWWAGAIHRALRAVHPMLQPGDFFAFMNNDTKVNDCFLAELVNASLNHGRAVVGSIVRAAEPPHALLDIGPRANLWNMAIWDIARDMSEQERMNPKEIYEVDFLPGRGTLFPGEVLDRTGYMRPWLLPHYHADYEFADRARRAGFPLIVASAAVTYSTDTFGNQRKASGFWQRKFGKGSPENTLQKLAFFCLVGTPAQRTSAIPRTLWAQWQRMMHPYKIKLAQIARHFISTGKFFLYHSLRALGLIRRQHDGNPCYYQLPWIPSSLHHRISTLLSAPKSSIARARILAAIERRKSQRIEALHVYAAALLVELQQGHIILTGSAAACYEPFFKCLRITSKTILKELPPEFSADLVFCAWDINDVPLVMTAPESYIKWIRPGGILYCAGEGISQCEQSFANIASRLGQLPDVQVLADSRNGWPMDAVMNSVIPAGAFTNSSQRHGNPNGACFFAVRRLPDRK